MVSVLTLTLISSNQKLTNKYPHLRVERTNLLILKSTEQISSSQSRQNRSPHLKVNSSILSKLTPLPTHVPPYNSSPSLVCLAQHQREVKSKRQQPTFVEWSLPLYHSKHLRKLLPNWINVVINPATCFALLLILMLPTNLYFARKSTIDWLRGQVWR